MFPSPTLTSGAERKFRCGKRGRKSTRRAVLADYAPCRKRRPLRPECLCPALVGDLLGAAVAAADDLLVLHFLVGDDVERVARHALLLQLRVDLRLQVLAGLALRRR